MSKKALVIGEVRDNELRTVTFEAIAASKSLEVDEVIGVIAGNNNLSEFGNEMIKYGADSVTVINHENLSVYTSESFSQAILEVINQESPDVIVMGHTAVGKDLTPKLANKIGSGLVSDVVEIDINDEVEFIRPIYSGKAFEKKVIESGISFFTIRPNNIKPLEKDEGLSGEVTTVEIEINSPKVKVIDIERKTTGGVDLSEADVIVAGGRGVKSEEGFKPLYELADILNGAVGASRAACDAEYCDYALQIGQTGKIVTPDLYISVGISGAIQHLAGMSNSKTIIAINKDSEANIFNVADYGIVGDLFEILPKLNEALKK